MEQALRIVLPRTAIIHHCVNEVTEPGPRGAKRQAILVGMGVQAGFADLMVICDGRILFLEFKAPKGHLRPDQEGFRDAVLSYGFGWALARSLDDALGALAEHGFTTRIAAPVGRPRPWLIGWPIGHALCAYSATAFTFWQQHTGADFEQEITADLPANSQFLSPRLYLNPGATAAAVAYDCAGLYLETDY